MKSQINLKRLCAKYDDTFSITLHNVVQADFLLVLEL